MASTVIPKNKLRRLRAGMPKGYLPLAVERMEAKHGRKLSRAYITQVISGHRFDQEVLGVLITLRDERRKELDDLISRI